VTFTMPMMRGRSSRNVPVRAPIPWRETNRGGRGCVAVVRSPIKAKAAHRMRCAVSSEQASVRTTVPPDYRDHRYAGLGSGPPRSGGCASAASTGGVAARAVGGAPPGVRGGSESPRDKTLDVVARQRLTLEQRRATCAAGRCSPAGSPSPSRTCD
jgi:hypothetical protein